MNSHDTTGTSTRIRRSLSGMLAAAVLTAGTLAGTAAWAANEHSHGHDAHALELNAGKKWTTDDPLRQGMTKIRAIVAPRLERIHAGKMDARGYAAMAAGVETQVAYIVKTCKLEPDADAMLHLLLAEIVEGIDAMKAAGKTAPAESGVVKIVAALNGYGKYFEHPGWKPVRTGH